MNKKLLMAILAGFMSLGMVACGDEPEEPAEDKEKTTEVDEEETEDAEESEIIQVPAKIENQTGVEFAALYFSGASLEEWGDDLLEDTLPDGSAADVTLNIDENNLQWDLRAEDSEGTAIEFQGLDISEASSDGFTIVLTFEDDQPMAQIVNEY